MLAKVIKSSSMPKLFAVTLSFALLATQLPSQKCSADGYGNAAVVVVVLTLVTEGPVLVNGAISTIGNFSYAVRGRKSPSAWRTYGYVFGALNMAFGGLVMASEWHSRDPGFRNFGIFQAGLGAAGLGFTIWSSVLDDGTEQSLSVAPFVMPDKEGGVTVGAGIKLAGW